MLEVDVKSYKKILNLLDKIRKDYDIQECYATDKENGHRVIITDIYDVDENFTRVKGYCPDKKNYYEFGSTPEMYVFDDNIENVKHTVILNAYLDNIKNELEKLRRALNQHKEVR